MSTDAQSQQIPQSQQTTSSWIEWLKAFGPYAAAVVAFMALCYQNQQFEKRFVKEQQDNLAVRDAETKQRLKDFKLKYYEQQMHVYADLCETVTTIANAKRMKDVPKAQQHFRDLVIGKLAMVADENVFGAVRMFNKELSRLGPESGPGPLLPSMALSISGACRDSLATAFDVTIGKIKDEESIWPIGSRE